MTEQAQELDTSVIRNALVNNDFQTVIDEVRAAVAADPVAATRDPIINQWMGMRYRNIFITEALRDEQAVKQAEAPFPLRLLDNRSEREKMAKRMLKRIDPAEIDVDMPEAQPGSFGNTTFVFAPGLITGLMPALGFQSLWPKVIERLGIKAIAVDAHPMRSGEANVEDVMNTLNKGIGVAPDAHGSFITEDDNPTPPGDVIFMGYSKGAVDVLTTLKNHPEIAPRVKGFIGWAGAMGGSYLADDMYERIKDRTEFDIVGDMHDKLGKLMLKLVPIIQVERITRRVDEYDPKEAVKSLCTWYRDDFNREYGQMLTDLGVPTFYFTGSATIFDVPWFQKQGVWDLSKYDVLNDMQLTQAQATPPMPNAPHLAMWRANHWDMTYDTFPWFAKMGSTHLEHPFAREAALTSIMLFMSEIGIMS